MSSSIAIERRTVLGSPISVIDMDGALDLFDKWAARKESRYVCICNAHSVVTARQDPALLAAIEAADLATPDGAPVAWMMRRLGSRQQSRVSGPDLMLAYCARAAASGEPIYLYGSRQETLDQTSCSGTFMY